MGKELNWAAWRRPLIVSAVLAGLLLALAWYNEPMFAAMLCMLAVLFQLLRLLYYLIGWNKHGLAGSGVRLLIWVAAMVGAGAIHAQYADQARKNGEALVAVLQSYRAREGRYPPNLEALVPRDVAAVPVPASPPGSPRKFHYRLSGEHFRLMYVTGFRMGSEFSSENGKWEALD
jgi:hypothetical protein